MVPSSEKSVQTFLFSSVGFELDPLQSWVGGRNSRVRSCWAQGSGDMQNCSAHHGARAQSLPGKETPWRARKKIGFQIFGQGSYFEYI